MKALLLSSSFLWVTQLAFGQTYLGGFGSLGLDGNYRHDRWKSPGYGFGLVCRKQLGQKWFLAGEVGLRSVGYRYSFYQPANYPPYYSPLSEGTYKVRHRDLNLAAPFWLGYYLSKPEARTRFWLGTGGAVELSGNYTNIVHVDRHLNYSLSSFILNHYLGVDRTFGKTRFSFQAAITSMGLYRTVRRQSYYTTTSTDTTLTSYKQSENLGVLHELPLPTQFRLQALFPLNPAKGTSLLLGAEALIKVTSYHRSYYDANFNTLGYIGLNLGFVWGKKSKAGQ